MTIYKEKPLFFQGACNRTLFGLLFQPEGQAKKRGIVYCHPFAEEMNMSHTVAVKSCRAFAKMGYPVMRFDMSGCGDSEGEFSDADVTSWQNDLDAAVNVLKQEAGVQDIGIFGIRLGGGLALLHEASRGPVSFIILWEPVLNFNLFIKHFLRRMISTQIVENSKNITLVKALECKLKNKETVKIIGYPITPEMYDSFCQVSQDLHFSIPRCPILVLSISLMDSPSHQLAAYFDLLEKNNPDACIEHIKAEPFWDRYWRWDCPEAIHRSSQWLSGIE